MLRVKAEHKLNKSFMNKKILILFLIGILILPVSTIYAQWEPPSMPTGEITELSGLLAAVVNVVWMIFAALGVIMIVIAGILFLTANGDPAKLTTARSAFIWGSIGIVVGIVAFSITAIIAGQLQ
jgi:hypothetical protein